MTDEKQEVTTKKVPVTSVILIIIVVLVAMYASRCFYTVEEGEQAVVKRFGEFNRTEGSGLKFRLPEPFENVKVENVEEVRKLEIGFRTISLNPARYRTIPQESLMLTGDENIVNVEFIVQYKIKDLRDFVFNVKKPQETLGKAAEAAMRKAIGETTAEKALTAGKSLIQDTARNELQTIIDKYKCGIYVVAVQLQDVLPPNQVIAAFKEVASAREERVTLKNQAEAYKNDVVPKAEGEAAKILNEAEGRAKEIENKATGEAVKFLKMYSEYKKSEDVTRKRLYYEKLSSTLADVQKIIIDEGDGDLFKLIRVFKSVEEAK